MQPRVIAVVLVLAVSLGLGYYVNSALKARVPEPSQAAPVSFSLDAPINIDYDAIPRVIAEIGGQPVDRERYVRALRGFERNARRVGHGGPAPDMVARVKQDILDTLINTELLLQRAQQNGVTVADSDVDAQIERIRANFPDADTFEQTLERQGLTAADLREEINRGLRIQLLLEREINPRVQVSEEDARAYYDGHPDEYKEEEKAHTAHILVRVDPSATADQRAAARAKAEAALARVTKGEDFAKVAAEISEDPGSAPRGGDVGALARNDVVPAYGDAAFALEPGQMSGVVESPFGYHIIKLIEKTPGRVAPYEEARGAILNALKGMKTNELTREYLARLRGEVKVKIFLPS
ncbi:MAG: peptidylprolyl isomerase [Nitrospinae bacterium]|nr:peptidylprolyl isomerase [Nitrospinota bacterium]